MEETAILPLHKRHSGSFRRGIWGSRLQEKLIHLIPVIVLLCFFILWWFSYPVNVEIKNGRITAVERVMLQNTPFSHLDDQASTFPPYPLISEVQMATNYSTQNEQEHKEKQ
ncbi:hypothetical protein CDL12_26788 [Handroanthus impetiginosus]|uniref:Uncharacterized protein n=1 Tax=Handroanthus impetiginosus TaxID=429701 RepID=A0A2G9G707_9LAMI|nr:hypothetical protein CDL12_26788 [Handroanthus impetiginosus]